jgi:hypothetical protein
MIGLVEVEAVMLVGFDDEAEALMIGPWFCW